MWGDVMAWFGKKSQSDIEDAETYMRGYTATYRHYSIQGVQDLLKGKIGSQGKIANISDHQVSDLIQKLRDEHGMGPNRPHQQVG